MSAAAGLFVWRAADSETRPRSHFDLLWEQELLLLWIRQSDFPSEPTHCNVIRARADLQRVPAGASCWRSPLVPCARMWKP